MIDHPRIPANDDGDFDPYHAPRVDWRHVKLTPEQDAALAALAALPMTPEKVRILLALTTGQWPPVA